MKKLLLIAFVTAGVGGLYAADTCKIVTCANKDVAKTETASYTKNDTACSDWAWSYAKKFMDSKLTGNKVKRNNKVIETVNFC